MAWLFVTPVVLGMLIFSVYPTVYSFYISLTRWDLVTEPRFVGADNFVSLFTSDRTFPKALSNTAYFALGASLPGLALALLFAILLNQKIRGRYIYRAIYFIPVIASTVAVALLWTWIYQPQFGIINFVLKSVGMRNPPRWLASIDWAMPAIIIMTIWQGLGYDIVIFLAGLQNISTAYYEAASIDGANGLQQFRHITLPLLSPVIFFAVVMSGIWGFQAFAASYLMTGGGPANATMTMILFLFNQAFRFHHMGLASAVAYCIFVIVIVLTILNFRLQKYWVFYEEGS